MKNIIRFLYIAVFIFVGIFVFTHPVKTETNILNAVLSSSESTLVKLSEKYSSQINVIFENADDETSYNVHEECPGGILVTKKFLAGYSCEVSACRAEKTSDYGYYH